MLQHIFISTFKQNGYTSKEWMTNKMKQNNFIFFIFFFFLLDHYSNRCQFLFVEKWLRKKDFQQLNKFTVVETRQLFPRNKWMVVVFERNLFLNPEKFSQKRLTIYIYMRAHIRTILFLNPNHICNEAFTCEQHSLSMCSTISWLIHH